MKKTTVYFKIMVIISALALTCTVLSPNGTVAALFTTLFIFIVVCTLNMPEDEMYKDKS